MSLQAVPLWIPLAADGVTQVQHPAELLRAMSKSLTTRSGVVHPATGITTVGTNTGGDFAGTVVPAAMQLTVGPGAAYIVGRETTLQGVGAYFAYSEASEVVSWPAASGSARMDSLLLQIDDPQYGSIGGNPLGATWRAVAGSSGSARPDSDFTSGGSQYIPGAWLRVYDVLVPASATQLTQANVAFKGGYANTMGYTPFYSTARPASGFYGERGFEADTGRYATWTGSLWDFGQTYQLLDAFKNTPVSIGPYQAAFTFTAETAIAKLTHPSIPAIRNGDLINFRGITIASTSALSEHTLIVRKNTAVSGAFVGAARITASAAANIVVTWDIEYPVTVDEANVSFFFSAIRASGSGTLALSATDGAGNQEGYATCAVIGPSGKFRTVT